MPEARSQNYFLFKLLLVVGASLGVLLLVQAVRNYRFVSQRMIHEELYREAARHSTDIARMARDAEVTTSRELEPVLEEMVRERPLQIAWLRVMNLDGQILAEAGDPQPTPFQPSELRRLFQSGERITRILETPHGRLLVILRPLRFRMGRGRPAEMGRRHPSGRPRAGGPPSGGPTLIELALHWEGVAPEFGGLRRNIFISVSAAIALLASMAFLALRFRSYVHGKQLEQQLELARKVQMDLLPKDPLSSGKVDIAAACEPAWQVGGDFYDFYENPSGRVTMVLGDVAGKGLPAALLMSMIHGAVRTSSALIDSMSLEDATRRLNDLICVRTSVERFVTMFWCQYDVDRQILCYVNAGHLAPFLVRRDDSGGLEVLRLDQGGPVLGVIPGAPYRQVEERFQPGDVLVMFSDGVVEAVNKQGEEFGELRLAELIRANAHRSAGELQEAIVGALRSFTGDCEQQDDVTLLVVRAGAAVPREQQVGAYAADVA